MQGSGRLDRFERDRTSESGNRSKVDAGPVPLGRRRIRIGRAFDLGDAHDLFSRHAVVEENPVSDFHGPEVVSGLEVPHAGPWRRSIPNETRPGKCGWFLFDEPVFHWSAGAVGMEIFGLCIGRMVGTMEPEVLKNKHVAARYLHFV